MGEVIGDRIRAIRELRGEKQPEFAAAMNAAAKRLKMPKNYSVSTISRLETGRQEVTLEDALVIAATDPQKRGRDWLAWGDSTVSIRESTMEKRLLPNPKDATSAVARKRGA